MKKTASLILTAVMIFAMFAGINFTAEAASDVSVTAKVVTSSGRLNVRTEPHISAKTRAALPNGYELELLKKSGDWWYVEYFPYHYGWCHQDYLSVPRGTAATVNTTSSRLNIRSGAGTGHSVLFQLDKGTAVEVIGEAGDWYLIIDSGGRLGYASRQYIKKSGQAYTIDPPATTPPATQIPADKYPAISLAVPSLKQTDSRWRSFPVGQSGKTIGGIGCAVTCLAMAESLCAGSIIRPDNLTLTLKFTSGGAVYWPSRYSAYFESDYLAEIYRNLQNGKAVLVGAKTAAGGQHWVIVTGYTGGASLVASKFTVNDPGSNTVTLLSQFFRDYPIFYKLMIYS